MLFDEDASLQQVALPAEIRSMLNLWRAVFLEGLRSFALERKYELPQPGEATRWFWSDVSGPGTFVWLCELFAIDPARARASVLARWRTLAKEDKPKKEK